MTPTVIRKQTRSEKNRETLQRFMTLPKGGKIFALCLLLLMWIWLFRVFLSISG